MAPKTRASLRSVRSSSLRESRRQSEMQRSAANVRARRPIRPSWASTMHFAMYGPSPCPRRSRYLDNVILVFFDRFLSMGKLSVRLGALREEAWVRIFSFLPRDDAHANPSRRT
jgi:hypothetical protein